jgi:hypothetical protein
MIKFNIEDRALHKQYLEVRDFANKAAYLDNFSGDPFLIVHGQRTKQRQPLTNIAYETVKD